MSKRKAGAWDMVFCVGMALMFGVMWVGGELTFFQAQVLILLLLIYQNTL